MTRGIYALKIQKKGDTKAMKFNVSMNDELFKKLDEEAKKNYLSRSGLVSLAVTKYLQDKQAMEAIGQFPTMFAQLEKMQKKDAK